MLISHLKYVLLLAALASSSVYANEAKVLQTLQKNYPQLGKIDKVNKANVLGLYEVVMNGRLFYTDEKARYLLNGNIYDLKSGRNLSEERASKLFAVEFDKLPLDLAIKRVYGKGERKVAYFADPNCSYCRKLEEEFKQLDNVTLYLFLYPVFPGSDEKVHNIACSANPAQAWEDLMLKGMQPAAGNCGASSDKVLALGKKLKIEGTPTLIFSDGSRSPGYLPAAELESALNGAVGL